MKKFLMLGLFGLLFALSKPVFAQGNLKILTTPQLVSKGDSLYLRFALSQYSASGPLGYSARLDSIYKAASAYSRTLSSTDAMNKLFLAAGANTSIGSATLVSGTVTISNTSITENSFVFLSRRSAGASTGIGALATGTRTAGTSFVVNALSSTNTVVTGDISVIEYIIVN